MSTKREKKRNARLEGGGGRENGEAEMNEAGKNK